MIVDVKNLLSGGERELPFEFEYAVPEDSVFRSSFPGVELKPVSVRGKILNMSGLIEVSGDVEVGYSTACARCAEPINGVFRTSFVRTAAAEQDEDDEYLLIVDDAIDLSVPVTEQLLSDFPSKLLCREDCRGLCPKCGKNLNDGDCGCSQTEADPRLEVLRRLLNK
ncbi:MAG: DUF177 domain-containing protein [Clostridia bacterium]|nr:DUF177 domain-containing protein [Clostridia bacterium]